MKRFAVIKSGVVEFVHEQEAAWPGGWPDAVEVPRKTDVEPGSQYKNGNFTTPPVLSSPQNLINAMEARHIAPRWMRELALTLVAERAAAAGVQPTALPAYVKLKALDDKIVALRGQL